MKEQDASRINGAFDKVMADARALTQDVEKLRAQLAEEQRVRGQLEARVNQLAARVFAGGSTK